MLAAVMDGDGVAHEIREDGGGPGPGLGDRLLAGVIHFNDTLHQRFVYKRSLLDGTAH